MPGRDIWHKSMICLCFVKVFLKSYFKKVNSLSFGRVKFNLKVKKKKKGKKARNCYTQIYCNTISCDITDIPKLKCFFFPSPLINISG